MVRLIGEHTTRKPKGAIFIYGPDGLAEHDTLQCVHCGMHWIVQLGSGRKRGWCWKCGGPSCGKKRCETRCIPAELELEMIEGSYNPNRFKSFANRILRR